MIRYLILCCVCFLALPFGSAFAYELPHKPDANLHIVDQANVVDATTEFRIQQIAAKLRVDRGISMVVVTIKELPQKPYVSSPTSDKMGIEEFGHALFNTWGIGYRAHNYGILFVVAVKEKKARIQFGSDWAHEYDGEAQKVMDTIIVPALKRERFAKGIFDGVISLDFLARDVLVFKMDGQKVGLISAIFALGALALKLPVFSTMSAPQNKLDWIYCAGVSVSFLALYFSYSYGFLNHLEWLNTLAFFMLTVIVYLSIYLFLYAGQHSATDTLFRGAKLVLMFLFVPMFIVGSMIALNSDDSVYGDGTADGGGGATGDFGD